MTDTALARAAYDAYGVATGGLNFRGEPMPAWADLGERIQTAWVAAARAAVDRNSANPGPGHADLASPLCRDTATLPDGRTAVCGKFADHPSQWHRSGTDSWKTVFGTPAGHHRNRT